jgi:TonB family protein
MKSLLTLSVSVFLSGALQITAAQAPVRPDFSGEWVLDPARTTLTGGPERITGVPAGRRGAPPNPDAPRPTVTPAEKYLHVSPVYPPEAQRSRISGAIMMEATIDTKGNVVDLAILRGVRELDDAAIKAVSQWKYRPATRDGKPIPVIMTVTVTFSVDGRPGSGTPTRSPSGRGPGMGSGGGGGFGPAPASLSINQDSNGLRVVRPNSAGGKETATYRFDGRRATNRLKSMGGLAANAELIFVSSWDGAKLATQIAWDAPSGPQNRLEAISLEGDTLVVELSRPPLEPGGEPIVRKTFYTRR